MPVRVAAIGVSHWHSLYDSAYLRHLSGMPDMQLVGLHDSSAAIAAKRAAVLGDPPVFTDYRRMLTETRPDFVIALGRHSTMAETALYLLDQGYPFLMEKPMGVNAEEVRRVADRAAAKNAFVAVPLIQRYHPFTARARSLLADGRFGPVSHIYFRLNRPTSARYAAWDATWMLDPKEAGGGCLRNLGRTAWTCSSFWPARRWKSPGRSSARGPSSSRWRTTPRSWCDPPAAFLERSRSATRFPEPARTASGRSPGATRF